MINERRRKTNRANARAATGPRTTAGKSRASRNALRHGLSVPVLADAALAAEVKALAREIAGDGAKIELQQLAVPIAEAQIDLKRARCARHDLLSRALSDSKPQPTPIGVFEAMLDDVAQRWGSDEPIPYVLRKQLIADLVAEEDIIMSLADCAERLEAIDRYERRALSRRKFAICAFDAACRQAVA